MIRLSNIRKTFRTSEVETTAVSNIDLTIAKGDFLAVMGPSGSGKSTLLSIVGMLDSATDGTYLFEGTDVSNASDTVLTRMRRQHTGFIFQAFNLIPHMTVERNVEVGLLYRSIDRRVRQKRCAAALRDVGLDARARHYPGQLSGGQQQRVAIARALVGNPSLILADEPTGNLDSRNGSQVMDILKAIAAAGTTIIMVTHDETLAKQAGRTVTMRDGRIVEH